jgi:hypothetical protein
MIDTALKTADSGYLTRRLVDVSQDVFTIKEEAEDPGFPIYKTDTEDIGVTLALRITGRFVAEDVAGHLKRGELITPEIAEAIEADDAVKGVRVMSALSCTDVRGV